MKKARIVTFLRAYNFGAVLQCYALSRKICEFGADCDVLDYEPEVFSDTYKMKAHPTFRHPQIKFMLRRMKALKGIVGRNKRFERFIQENIPLTAQQYKTSEQLKRLQSDVDIYITGSDQVWSHIWSRFDPVFFLDFPDANCKEKYSYAASFGFKEYPKELFNEFVRRLKGYKQYSVREYSAVPLVKEAVGAEARVDCDPTLLITPADWSSMVKERIISEPYILLYYTAKSELLHEKAEELRKKTGYKVVALPCLMDIAVLSGKYEKGYGYETFASAGPEEFLNLFKYAEHVLTNTFHGTVFSIIFHKNFMTQMIGHDGSPNHRVHDLFSMLGITGRCLETEFDNMAINPNWDSVDEMLKNVREKSSSYLLNIINE